MKIPASPLAARNARQPCVVIKVGHVDDQRISLPAAYGVTEVRGIHVGAMWPAIDRHKAKTPWWTLLCIIEKHNELGRLDDLPWRSCARDAERLTVEFWVVLNFIGSQLSHLCQQLRFVRRWIRIHEVLQLLAKSGVKFGCCATLIGGRVNIEVTYGVLMGTYRQPRGLPGAI